MGVTPSGVDDRHRQQILEQLDGDMFYIFMIWNKSLKTHTLIYDMENNVLYDDGDITVKIAGDDSMDAFLSDAKAKVQQRKTVYHVKHRKSRSQENLQCSEPEQEEHGSIWDRRYYGSYAGFGGDLYE